MSSPENQYFAPAEEGESLGVDVGVSHGRLVIDPCGLEAEEAARLVIVRQRLQVVHRGGEGGVAYLRLGIVSVRAAQVDDPGGGERLEAVQIGVALAGHLVDDDQEAVHHHLRETLAIGIDIAREKIVPQFRAARGSAATRSCPAPCPPASSRMVWFSTPSSMDPGHPGDKPALEATPPEGGPGGVHGIGQLPDPVRHPVPRGQPLEIRAERVERLAEVRHQYGPDVVMRAVVAVLQETPPERVHPVVGHRFEDRLLAVPLFLRGHLYVPLTPFLRVRKRSDI